MLKLILAYLAILTMCLRAWFVSTFGVNFSAGVNITIEQIVFHLFSGLGGVEPSIIIKLILDVVIAPIILTAFWVVFIKRFIKEKALNSYNFYLISLLSSLLYLLYTINVLDALKNSNKKAEDIFTVYYSNPNKIKFLNPKNKKNLILIYFESLETSLRDSKVHGSNLIQEVDNLPGVNINNFACAPGTTWSMAAMMSSQCGVPLKVFYGNLLHIKTTFMPKIICLGNILKQYGYKQYFLQAPASEFAGSNKFYLSHGYDFLYGKQEWVDKGVAKPDLFTGWGASIHDDVLFEEAKKIISQNVASGALYNLTVITTDSHNPEGFPSLLCSKEDQNAGFRGAFRCSSKIVANFINDLKAKNLLDNTVVVLMGDHTFVATKEQARFFPKKRDVYFKIIYGADKRPTRDIMNHFDVAPTVLDLLGIINSKETNYFGLGISVFANIKAKDYKDHYGKVISKKILNNSSTYNNFW